MEILFKNTEELRKHISFLYATADFEALRTDIVTATEDVITYVGRGIYEQAVSAYNHEFIEEFAELVEYFQLPIALLAYRYYSQNNDVSHEATGRKIKIDKESETMPWEWQIERDDNAILKKANRAIDRLIDFLDDHISYFKVWGISEQRKDKNELFVRSAKEFNQVVPIDESRLFFIRVLPFVRQADKEIVTYIGQERYDAIKTILRDNNYFLTAEQRTIVELARDIIPQLVMAKAVRRFAVQILPDCVVSRFSASSQSLKASSIVSSEMLIMQEGIYQADANKAIVRLQQYIRKISPLAVSPVEDSPCLDKKYFSV